MGKIIAFKDLEEKSRNEILRASMTADFDSRLSFGLVNENNTLLGYSLLKPESIDSSIEIKATFDSSHKGAFNYLWATPKNSFDVNFLASCLDCKQEEYLEDIYTKRIVIYNVFNQDSE